MGTDFKLLSLAIQFPLDQGILCWSPTLKEEENQSQFRDILPHFCWTELQIP